MQNEGSSSLDQNFAEENLFKVNPIGSSKSVKARTCMESKPTNQTSTAVLTALPPPSLSAGYVIFSSSMQIQIAL